MIKHGVAPFLECSGKGDPRFSAFRARIRKYNNRSIEEIYQASKILEDGSTGLSIKQAKGKKPVNFDETAKLYSDLWNEYIFENVHLVEIILAATGLSDIFGQPGHVCQATELWRIRNELLDQK